MTNEIELGRINQYSYRLVQVVQVRHVESDELIDTIEYQRWPDRLEAQLFRYQQRVAELEQALAQREALIASAVQEASDLPADDENTALEQLQEAPHITGEAIAPAGEIPLLADDPPQDPAIVVPLPDAPAAAEKRPYYCADCDKDFSTRKYPQQAIRHHLKTTHAPKPAGYVAPERPYYCAICDVDFADYPNPAGALRGHLANGKNHRVRKPTKRAPEVVAGDTAEDDPTPQQPIDLQEAPQPIDLAGDIELAHRIRSAWPRPCPVCWAAGREKELPGPRAMKQHLVDVHSLVVPSVGHTGERPTAQARAPKATPIHGVVSCLTCHRKFDSEQAFDRHRCRPVEMPRIIVAPPAVQLAPNRQPFGAPVQLTATDGWACSECHSGVFAPSVKNPKVCQRCIALLANTAS